MAKLSRDGTGIIIDEEGGPTAIKADDVSLSIGAIGDSQFVERSGDALIGVDAPSGGGITSVQPGLNTAVDATDPANPIVKTITGPTFTTTTTVPGAVFPSSGSSPTITFSHNVRITGGSFTMPASVTANDNSAIVTFDTGATHGTQFGGTPSNLLSVYDAPPAPQFNATGSTAGFTANTGTPVLSGSTFTGGIGSKGYTGDDIVAALKTAGWLAKD